MDNGEILTDLSIFGKRMGERTFHGNVLETISLEFRN
jgi:hypothetical protein